MTEPRTEQQQRWVDYLVAYGQSRAAGRSFGQAVDVAGLVQRGKALQRSHDRAVLPMELRP